MKTKILKFLDNGTISLKACNTDVYNQWISLKVCNTGVYRQWISLKVCNTDANRQWISEKNQNRLADYLFELAHIDEFVITRSSDSVLNLDLYKERSIVWQGSIYLY